MTQTVLILGATGKIGRHAAQAFGTAGWQVRRYTRGTDMTQAARGADVIINGLNPPNYHNWAQIIPAITTQVIAAAQASGATVIIPGNIYNFGNQPGVLSAQTSQRPNSRKGQIRVRMEQAYRDAGVQTIILRAGNFIDPDDSDDVMRTLTLRHIKRNKLTAAGDPDADQAYAYLPDWARAALALAEMRHDLTRFTDLPFPGHTFTLHQLGRAIAQQTGRPIKITPFPWLVMTALSPFWELARELREMRYLFDMSHRLDGAAFAALLPDFQPTPRDHVMLCALPRDIHPNKAMRPSGKAVLTQ